MKDKDEEIFNGSASVKCEISNQVVPTPKSNGQLSPLCSFVRFLCFVHGHHESFALLERWLYSKLTTVL
jgi:hypothetical protein